MRAVKYQWRDLSASNLASYLLLKHLTSVVMVDESSHFIA